MQNHFSNKACFTHILCYIQILITGRDSNTVTPYFSKGMTVLLSHPVELIQKDQDILRNTQMDPEVTRPTRKYPSRPWSSLLTQKDMYKTKVSIDALRYFLNWSGTIFPKAQVMALRLYYMYLTLGLSSTVVANIV